MTEFMELWVAAMNIANRHLWPRHKQDGVLHVIADVNALLALYERIHEEPDFLPTGVALARKVLTEVQLFWFDIESKEIIQSRRTPQSPN